MQICNARDSAVPNSFLTNHSRGIQIAGHLLSNILGTQPHISSVCNSIVAFPHNYLHLASIGKAHRWQKTLRGVWLRRTIGTLWAILAVRGDDECLRVTQPITQSSRAATCAEFKTIQCHLANDLIPTCGLVSRNILSLVLCLMFDPKRSLTFAMTLSYVCINCK